MDRQDRWLRKKLRRNLREGGIVTVVHNVNSEPKEFQAMVYRVGRTRGRVQAIMRDYEKSNRIMRSWYNLSPDAESVQGFTLTQHFANLRIPFTSWRLYFYPDNEYFEKGLSEGYEYLNKKLTKKGL